MESKASAFLSHFCISRNSSPLIFLDQETILARVRRKVEDPRLTEPLNYSLFNQRKTSALLHLSMAQVRTSKILPPCTHLDLCGADRLWSSSGKVYSLDLWRSWLPSGTEDFKFHIVTVSVGRASEPLQSLSPWSTAALSPTVTSSILLRSYLQLH